MAVRREQGDQRQQAADDECDPALDVKPYPRLAPTPHGPPPPAPAGSTATSSAPSPTGNPLHPSAQAEPDRRPAGGRQPASRLRSWRGDRGRGDPGIVAGHALNQLVGALATGPGRIRQRRHTHRKLLNQLHFDLQAPGARKDLHTLDGRGGAAHHEQTH
jgi:hypothetical protein